MIDKAIFTSPGSSVNFGGGGSNSFIGAMAPWVLSTVAGTESDKPADERFFYFANAFVNNGHIVLRPGLYIVSLEIDSHGFWTPDTPPGAQQFMALSQLDLVDAFGGGGNF